MEYEGKTKWQEEPYLKARGLVRALKRSHWQGLKRDRNVLGAAFGQRTAHGEKTDEPAMVIYVMKKVPKAGIPLSRLLPRRMYVGGDCVEVDVVETGPIYAQAFTARERPATSGISVGHFNITAGTIGALVTDNGDGTTCLLSNNHVLADENAGVVGDAIIQQGSFDGGGAPADTIATLKRFVMITATGNTVDAAIGEVTRDAAGGLNLIDQVHNNIFAVPSPGHRAVGLLFAGSCSRTIMSPIDNVLALLNISFPAGPGSTVGADIGMNVEKVGRTTEYTTSTIQEIDATVMIGYDMGDREFDGQITTAWMSDGGDSGSVVYEGGIGGEQNNCEGCASSSAVEAQSGLDLKQERCMAEIVRDKFLRPTKIGRWAVDLFYLNEDRGLERLSKTEIDLADREYGRKLYDKHAEEVRQAFVEGERSDRKVTDQHIREARTALKRAQKYMSKDERDASERLFALAERHAKGKTAKQLLALLNDEKIFNELQEIVEKVDFIKTKDEPCR
jgi:hypothetical protein